MEGGGALADIGRGGLRGSGTASVEGIRSSGTAVIGPDLTLDIGPDLTLEKEDFLEGFVSFGTSSVEGIGSSGTTVIEPDLTLDIGPDLTLEKEDFLEGFVSLGTSRIGTAVIGPASIGPDLTLDAENRTFLEGGISCDTESAELGGKASDLRLDDTGVVNLPVDAGAALGSSGSLEILPLGEITMCPNGKVLFLFPRSGDANSERNRIGAEPNDNSESMAGGS